MKRILLLEDNETSRKMIEKIINEIDEQIRVFSFTNATDAYEAVMMYSIDLFIIDIILDRDIPGDVSGMIFLDRIRDIPKYKYSPVIIISVLTDPKLSAYSQLHCFSYIEKPISFEGTKKIIKEALDVPVQHWEKKYVYFRKDGILYSVLKREIIYIEVAERKSYIVCENETICVPYKSCKQMLAELDSDKFIQCNRNTIVNRQYIKTVDYVNRFITLKETDKVLEIGAILKKQFMKEFNND